MAKDRDDDDRPKLPPVIDPTPIAMNSVVMLKVGGPLLVVTTLSTDSLGGIGYNFDGDPITQVGPLVAFVKLREPVPRK